MSSVIEPIASIASAVGAGFVVFQLRQAQVELRSAFERSFVERYERIAERLDLKALLGHPPSRKLSLDDPEVKVFFQYFELCEEELYYRAVGRVSRRAWRDWWEGIALNFRSPAFSEVFELLTVSGPEGPGRRHARFTYLTKARLAVEAGTTYDPCERRLRRLRR